MPSLYNETNKRKQLEMEGSENESDYSPLEENQNALEEEDIDNDNVVDDDYDIYSAPNEVVTETKNLDAQRNVDDGDEYLYQIRLKNWIKRRSELRKKDRRSN